MQSTLARHGIEHTVFHTSRIKRHATGKGGASKGDMMAAFKARTGRDACTDDEADAFFLLDLTEKEFGGER